MIAHIGGPIDPQRTASDRDTRWGAVRETSAAGARAATPYLRATPQSPLPSEFERAVVDTAAHARYTGRCEAALRLGCRRCAVVGAGLLALAATLAFCLPTPWLATVPVALAAVAGWRWAVLSAAADELHAHAAH